MEQRRCRTWNRVLLAGVALGLGMCAAAVYGIDPFFHYRDPDPEAEVWFDQRAQNAGVLRSQQYETLLMGSSLAENYRPFWFDNLYHTSTVKITFPNGGLGEFTTALEYANTRQNVKRVIFGLDPNLLARDPAEEPSELPLYLYDDDPWNDGQYLLSKDALLRAGYALMQRVKGQTRTMQDAFVWDGYIFFGREAALGGYLRPERAEAPAPADAFSAYLQANLAVVTGWLEQYPDTEFIFFFSPYSILFWDKMDRLGQTEAMLTLLESATETLLGYDNAQLHFFMADRETITDLDNYVDHIHVAGRITYRMALDLPENNYRMTEENRETMLEQLREIVTGYDFAQIWE